jgi:thioredoxin reductase
LLKQKNIELIEDRLQSLRGNDRLHEIAFTSGRVLECEAVFFNTPSTQQSWLGARVGCEFNQKQGIKCDSFGRTSIKGLYAAGNTIKGFGLAIEAAAEGAKSAYAINNDLTDFDFNLPKSVIQTLNAKNKDSSKLHP